MLRLSRLSEPRLALDMHVLPKDSKIKTCSMIAETQDTPVL